MTVSFILSTIFELFLVIGVFWGAFNEDKLITFEKRIIATIKRRRLRVVKSAPVRTYSNIVYFNEN